MRQAGILQASGIDGLAWLRDDDPVESLTKLAILEQAQEERKQWSRNLAAEIANAVGRMLSGK